MTFTQRKEIAEQVDTWIKDNDVQYCTFTVITYLDMKELIRKKGKWIDDGFQEEWWGEQFTCSICGGTMIGISKYCPECGAEMIADEEVTK